MTKGLLVNNNFKAYQDLNHDNYNYHVDFSIPFEKGNIQVLKGIQKFGLKRIVDAIVVVALFIFSIGFALLSQRFRQYCLETIKGRSHQISVYSDTLPPSIAKTLLKTDGLWFEFFSEKLKKNKELAITALQQNGLALQYASRELQNDKDVALTAIRNNKLAFEYISKNLKNDKDIIEIARKNKVITSEILSPKIYSFTDEPIDVVIPSIEKDLPTLELCIDAIKRNCKVRRIIVISNNQLTDKAEWFDEKKFPFSKSDVALWLLKGNKQLAQEFLSLRKPDITSVGWYYQQLLKLYASFTIPKISSNVLVLDSDTVFLNPVTFVNGTFAGLYSLGTEHHAPYFSHAQKLVPGLTKVFSSLSGICHHMLFQRIVLNDLFATVEELHHMPFWKAFCNFVDQGSLEKSGASEYEIYFNYVFTRTRQVETRSLKWMNSSSLDVLQLSQKEGYHYVSLHSWMRQ